MDRVAHNVVAEQGFEGSAVHHVAGAVEEVVDVELQPGVLEDPHGPILIEFHQHIDIAVRIGFSPRDRAEYCGVRHTEQPQLAFVSAESSQDVVKGRSHLSPRVYQTGTPDAAESRYTPARQASGARGLRQPSRRTTTPTTEAIAPMAMRIP